MPLALVLLLTLAIVSQTQPAAPPKDALALLNEVSQRYADAKSYHIEAVEERTSTNELSRSWQKEFMTAIVMADGRYRYEGRSGFGSASLLSDGTTQWDYHSYDHLYTEQPASPDDPQAGHIIPQEEMPVHNAKFLVNLLAHRADRVKSATYLPDETIIVNGKNVDCYVVHFASEFPQDSDAKFEETIWIDKSRKVIVKTVSRNETYSMTSARGHIPLHTETTVTYPVVELDPQEPDSSFKFQPPSDAKLVQDFPDYFKRNLEPGTVADLVGKPAPQLQLKDSSGKITTLDSFRGKPVLLEFWATWCAPCINLMPQLNQLYAETEGKGLVWIGIDYDKDRSAVSAFLARDRISWPNYHDDDGSIAKAFQRKGIPLGVLIDAEGKITFYKSEYGIAELRTAIAKLGPEFSSVAPAGVNAEGENSK